MPFASPQFEIFAGVHHDYALCMTYYWWPELHTIANMSQCILLKTSYISSDHMKVKELFDDQLSEHRNNS